MNNSSLKEKWTVILHYCYLCQQNLKETSRKKCCEVFSLEAGYFCGKCRKKFSTGYELRRIRNIPTDSSSTNMRVYVSSSNVGIEVATSHDEADVSKISDGSSEDILMEDFSNVGDTLNKNGYVDVLNYSGENEKPESDLSAGTVSKDCAEDNDTEIKNFRKGITEQVNTVEKSACSEDNRRNISERMLEDIQKDFGKSDPISDDNLYDRKLKEVCVVLLKDIKNFKDAILKCGSNTIEVSDIEVSAENTSKEAKIGMSSEVKMPTGDNKKESYMISEILKSSGEIKKEIDSDSECLEVAKNDISPYSNSGMNLEVLIPVEDINKEYYSDDTELESEGELFAEDKMETGQKSVALNECFTKEDGSNVGEMFEMCTESKKLQQNVDPLLDDELDFEDNLKVRFDNNNISLGGLCESESVKKDNYNNTDGRKNKYAKKNKITVMKKMNGHNRISKRVKKSKN